MNKGRAIVTGADGGMGRYITCALANAGYEVIMACMNTPHGEKIRAEIIEKVPAASIQVRHLNLTSIHCIVEFATSLCSEGITVMLLMNNAGLLTSTIRCTEDNIESLVSVNYIGPYLLTRNLLPIIGKGARIINTVSCTYAIGKIAPEFLERGCHGSFHRIPVYSNTKLALFLFTRELAIRLIDKSITVNAADPGIVSTNMIRMHQWFDPLTDIFYRPFIKSAAQGASTAIYLALSKDVEGVTGELFANCKQKKLSEKFRNHPQQKSLWNDTEDFLKTKGFPIKK